MVLNLNLKGEEASIPTTLTGLTLKEMVAYAVPTHASTTLALVTPVTLKLKAERVPAHATTLEVVSLKAEEMPTHPTALEVVRLKVEEMPTHPTALEAVSLKVEEMPTHPTTLEVVPPMTLK